MIEIKINMDQALNKINKAVWEVHEQAYYYCGRSQVGPKMLALKYLEKVRRDIIANAYVGKWGSRARRYSPRYDWWKHVTAGSSGRFWDLYGDLISKLQIFRVDGNNWMTGVPEGVTDRGGKSWFDTGSKTIGKSKSIAMYGNVLEFGLQGGGSAGNHPARPIFEPALVNFAYNDSPIIGEEILNRVAMVWR
jgi:hypothetical protein